MNTHCLKHKFIKTGLALAFLVILGVFSQVLAKEETYLSNALIQGKTVQRWNDKTRTIAVYIQSGEHLRDWRPENLQLLKGAFSEWENALGGRLRFEFTPYSEKSDIIVHWALNPNGSKIGHQNIRWTNNTLTHADIEVALSSPEGKKLTDTEVKSVALHEIGHVLGIRGHSNNPQDIMFPNIQPNTSHLSGRDIATALALYRLKPDITNPEGIHLAEYREFNYYIRQGYSKHQAQEHEAAYDNFKKAEAIYPADTHIAYYLGVTAHALKHYDEAIRNLEKASQIANGDQQHAIYYLGTALLSESAKNINNNQHDLATEKLNRAKSLFDSLQQNPRTTDEIRQMAAKRIEDVSSQLKLLSDALEREKQEKAYEQLRQNLIFALGIIALCLMGLGLFLRIRRRASI